jgi:hypothetical protein
MTTYNTTLGNWYLLPPSIQETLSVKKAPTGDTPAEAWDQQSVGQKEALVNMAVQAPQRRAPQRRAPQRQAPVRQPSQRAGMRNISQVTWTSPAQKKQMQQKAEAAQKAAVEFARSGVGIAKGRIVDKKTTIGLAQTAIKANKQKRLADEAIAEQSAKPPWKVDLAKRNKQKGGIGAIPQVIWTSPAQKKQMLQKAEAAEKAAVEFARSGVGIAKGRIVDKKTAIGLAQTAIKANEQKRLADEAIAEQSAKPPWKVDLAKRNKQKGGTSNNLEF